MDASWLLSAAALAAAAVCVTTLVLRRRRASRPVDTGAVSSRWLAQANWEHDE